MPKKSLFPLPFSWGLTTLRLFLSLPCGVASDAEKVKSQLRSTMSQEGIVVLCLRASMQSLFYNMAGVKRKGATTFFELVHNLVNTFY